MSYLLHIFSQNNFAVFIFWIIASLAIAGLSLEVREKFKLDLPTSLLVTCLGLINILYWGTYLNFFFTQMVLLLFGLIAFIKNYKYLRKDLVEYLSLTVITLWLAGLSIGNVPFAWDEFFWTLFDQHIVNYSSYWTTKSGILITHIRYMPGSALWHSFFELKGNYNEATAYFSVSLFLLVIIYWLTKEVLKENRHFILPIIVLALGCFSEGWFTLYVDQIVGLMMSLALIIGISYLNGDKSKLPLLVLVMATSILFKETGIIPSLAIMCTLFIILFQAGDKKIDWLIISGLIYCFLIIMVWKFYLYYIGASNPITWELLTDTSPKVIQFQSEVLNKFIRYIATDYIMLAVWAISILGIISINKYENRTVIYIYFIFTILGFIGIHLVAWLYLVGDQLAGSTRYMGSLLLAIFTFFIIYIGKKEKIGFKFKLILILFLVWPPINLISFGIKPSALFMLMTPHPKQVPIAKSNLKELKKKIPANLIEICKNRPTKVWFIHQNSIGYEAMMARHLLTPCQVAPGSFSLGEPYYDGDIWTANYTGQQFIEHASLYPYLIISKIDEKFIKNYQNFFDSFPEAGVLYIFDYKKNIFIRNF